MVSGIYKIENLINHKVYIGQSKDVFERWNQHVKMSKRENVNTHLYYSMKHYGVDNFSFELLKETYDLDYWERFFICWYDSCNYDKGYNLTTGGQKNSTKTNKFIYTEEIKSKMSESKKRNWQDSNFRENIIKAQQKGKWTDEARKKRSEATKRMWEAGKFANQAEKIAVWSKGRKHSDETKTKMIEISKIREAKHHDDYEIYLSRGGDLRFCEFRKHYKNGVNDLL